LATLAGTEPTLTTIKLRAHFFLINLAILVLVQGGKRLRGIFQFIRT
jgi:hypothetical protein